MLLRAAVLHAGDFKDPRIDPLLDRAWHGMLDRRDHRGAAAVLGQAMITAQSRADLARLAVVAEWGDRLDGPVSPVVTLLCRTVAAMRAEIGGDPEAALAEFARAPVHEVPRALALSVWRFHFHCLNMCGRGREAAELADRTLAEAGDELVRLSGAMARWFDGDPSDLSRLRRQGLGARPGPRPGRPGTGARPGPAASGGHEYDDGARGVRGDGAGGGDGGLMRRRSPVLRRFPAETPLTTTTLATPSWPAPPRRRWRQRAARSRRRGRPTLATWPGGPSKTGLPNGTCAGSWPSATS